jgi:hypothetical protein
MAKKKILKDLVYGGKVKDDEKKPKPKLKAKSVKMTVRD